MTSNALTLSDSARSLFLGYDSLFNRLSSFGYNAFPHFNIIKSDTGYIVEVAVAGYKKEDISIKHDKPKSILSISGRNTSRSENKRLMAQGISNRNFNREFSVADGVEVISAKLADGILTIELSEPLRSPGINPVEIPITE